MAGKEMVFRALERVGAEMAPREVLRFARENFDPSCKWSRIQVAMWRLAGLGVIVHSQHGKYRLPIAHRPRI